MRSPGEEVSRYSFSKWLGPGSNTANISGVCRSWVGDGAVIAHFRALTSSTPLSSPLPRVLEDLSWSGHPVVFTCLQVGPGNSMTGSRI